MRIQLAAWTLVAISSGFAIVSAIAFLVAGAFTTGWLVASAVVYGLVAVSAIALAAFDRAPAGAAPPAPAGPRGEPALVQRETIYATNAGEAVRLTYRWPDDTIEIRHVAMTDDQMLNDVEIETYVDALPPGQEPNEIEDEVEAVLAQREKATPPEETA